MADRLAFHSIPEPNSGCVLWLGPVHIGYGLLGVNGKMLGAHRLAWEAANGPIPKGMFVCHKCDVRSCINPEHLFLGTPADNHADMVRKGRNATGARNPRSRLNAEQVVAIRSDVRMLREIAADYGVHHCTIHLIKKRQNWKHIP